MTVPDPATWLEAEPDDDLRVELAALIADGSQAALAELADRFSGPLTFGTAGLRGPVAAGPRRMNRLVVRQAAAGLVDYLISVDVTARERGLLIGFDARRKSEVFAWDSARVAAARGMRVRIFSSQIPTPVLAWSIPQVGAAGGVMVTASHNPPRDNGYKVFLSDGSQIVDPVDTSIATHIAAVDLASVPMTPPDDPLIEIVGEDQIEAYVRAVASVRLRPDVAGIRVAYTALHGVGGQILLDAFERAGLPRPVVVARQQEPDGAFPTVAFPNPEEPGAMDLVIDLARSEGLGVALANDPDADRLGAAIATRDGSWRRLSGDEIGWLLADHVLTHSRPGDDQVDRRLVVTTLVSSSLLAQLAAAHGARCIETFTGFKWIARTAREHPELDLVFGYEQALGYLVGNQPLDKDGIGAAVAFTEVASLAAAQGRTIEDLLDGLAARFGRHLTAERSIPMTSSHAAHVTDHVRHHPPVTLAGRAVVSAEQYPQASLVRLVLSGGHRPVRVHLRPSGTEPKLKIYAEAVDEDPTPLVEAVIEYVVSLA